MRDEQSMTVQQLVESAQKDRFALIIPETEEFFARQHLEEILSIYPCSGILVERNTPRVLYHGIRLGSGVVESILRDGLRPSAPDNDYLTFGGGVIYCYPSTRHFRFTRMAVFAVYAQKYLQAIYKDDADEFEDGWDEALVFPENVIQIEHCRAEVPE